MNSARNAPDTPEQLNVEIISMLSRMNVLAAGLIDKVGDSLIESLTIELENSERAGRYFDERDIWTMEGHRTARLLLMQTALWVAEQLQDESTRKRLHGACATSDLLTLYLNAKEFGTD